MRPPIRGGGPQGRRTRSPLGRQVRPSSHRLGRRRRVEHLGRAGVGCLGGPGPTTWPRVDRAGPVGRHLHWGRSPPLPFLSSSSTTIASCASTSLGCRSSRPCRAGQPPAGPLAVLTHLGGARVITTRRYPLTELGVRRDKILTLHSWPPPWIVLRVIGGRKQPLWAALPS